ncbi:membrane protein [Oleiagrimonas soli]|nr:membrane protein [Oleiagrimonas soli]
MSTLRRFIPVALATSMLALAGCATGPYNSGGNGAGYGTSYSGGNGYRNSRSCPSNQCGVVEDVSRVYVSGGNQSHVLGTIIGAVAGAALGNQVGKGDGRKAATVAGAVAGGAVGNEVAKRNSGDVPAYRVVVRLDDGRTATVTQREDPRVRNGDYVQISDGRVYMR